MPRANSWRTCCASSRPHGWVEDKDCRDDPVELASEIGGHLTLGLWSELSLGPDTVLSEPGSHGAVLVELRVQ